MFVPPASHLPLRLPRPTRAPSIHVVQQRPLHAPARHPALQSFLTPPDVASFYPGSFFRLPGEMRVLQVAGGGFLRIYPSAKTKEGASSSVYLLAFSLSLLLAFPIPTFALMERKKCAAGGGFPPPVSTFLGGRTLATFVYYRDGGGGR